MEESRTYKSIKNANIALVFYLIGLLLNFISRKVFIDHLGADVLGLNTIVVNMLSFMNLAELGIGSAVSYSLYKPLHEKDHNTIQEIITVQGYFYRRVACFVIFASCVLMMFFPLIFKKSNLPLWYSYSTFGILLISSLMSYIWNYKQILLTADQKQYKITINQQGLTFVKVIMQIVSILLFNKYSYVLWLFFELIFSIIKTMALSNLISKEYKWLTIDLNFGKMYLLKYNDIIIKTKQLFFHKLSALVLTQSSPLIIYSFASLSDVAVYGNYMLIITGLSILLNSIFASISSSVGNLVSHGDLNKILNVFFELFVVRFCLVCIVVISFVFLVQPFMMIWMGSSFLFNLHINMLLSAMLFILTIRSVVDSFIQAYGLFQDIYATIIEVILNISLSLVLGYFFGIQGVLYGVLISLVIIVLLWKPFFLFKYGFNVSITPFLKLSLLLVLCLLLSLFATRILFDNALDALDINNVFAFILISIEIVSFNACFMVIGLLLVSKGMRDFCKRLKTLLFGES